MSTRCEKCCRIHHHSQIPLKCQGLPKEKRSCEYNYFCKFSENNIKMYDHIDDLVAVFGESNSKTRIKNTTDYNHNFWLDYIIKLDFADVPVQIMKVEKKIINDLFVNLEN